MKPRIGISDHPRTVDTVLGPTALAGVPRSYVDSVARAGGLPLVLPLVDSEDVPALLDAVHGLVLTGGGDISPDRYGSQPIPETDGVDPARDEFDLRLLSIAVERRLPVLAVCRGMQVLNVALGGSLVQHVPALTGWDHREFDRSREGVHGVTVDPHSHLVRALGISRLRVNSLHHQAVCDAAPALRPVAWADDGTIEAVEQDGNGRLVAVQWHPELMEDSPEQQGLFRHLVEQAARAASPGSLR